MRRVKNIAIGFLSLNILVALPVFLLLTFEVPDMVALDFGSSGPMNFRIFDSRTSQGMSSMYCSPQNVATGRAHGFLGGRFDESTFAFGMDGVKGDMTVASITVTHRFLIERQLDARTLRADYECRGGAHFVDDSDDGRVKIRFEGGKGEVVPKGGVSNGWRLTTFENRLLVCAIAATELAFLILALLLSFCAPKTFDVRKALVPSAWVAAFAAVFFCLILPLQSFMVNASMFKFGLGKLLLDCSINVVIAFVGIFLVLLVLHRLWGGIATVALTGFLIYEYLETGILAIGDVQFNGELVGFVDWSRAKWDAALLVGSIVVPALFYRKIVPIVHWVALAFAFLSALSLFDVKREKTEDGSLYAVSSFAGRKDITKGAFYSRSRNVIVFVLDMATTEAFEDVMRRDPTLRQKFDGFTCYRNNLGMHMYTQQGTAAIFSGMYLDKPSELTQYAQYKFSNKSFIKPYADADIPSFILPGSVNFGYSNRLRSDLESTSQEVVDNARPMLRRVDGSQLWNMFEIVFVRVVPFAVRQYVFKMCMLVWPLRSIFINEKEVYSVIRDCGEFGDGDLTLHYYHTEGTHEPLAIDRDGHRLPEAQFGYEPHVEKLWYALKQLGSLFDWYRAKGIYDKSLIVICADHGGEYQNGNSFIQDGLSPNALPCLLVKPEGSAKPWDTSVIPTSHANISKLVLAAKDTRLDQKGVENILRADKRFYRRFVGDDKIDYYVDATGRVSIVTVKSDRRKEDLKILETGVKYSLNANRRDKNFDFICDGLETDLAIPRFNAQEKMSISVRVDDASRTYDMTIGASPYVFGNPENDKNKTMRFSADGAQDVVVDEGSLSKSLAVVLLGVRPDSNGVLTVRAEREGMMTPLFITDIEIK